MEVDGLYAHLFGTLDVLRTIVDEQGFGWFQSVFINHHFENLLHGFAHTHAVGEIGPIEKRGYGWDAARIHQDVVEGDFVDDVGIAKQEEVVVHAQLLQYLQAAQWEVEQHGVPGGEDLPVGDRHRRSLVHGFKELLLADAAHLQVVEQGCLLELGVQLAEVGDACGNERVLGKLVVDIE